MKIGLMGLGVIGVPIAHMLIKSFHDDFFLIADNDRKERIQSTDIYINDEHFSPCIYTDSNDGMLVADIVIVCIKNYDLRSSLKYLNCFVSNNTIILPLQNGIYAYGFFEENFPSNKILHGFVQGPNTEKTTNGFSYINPGEIHIGSPKWKKEATDVADILCRSGITAIYENDIITKVWKKWMLNIAGNSVTALTGADYSLFKIYANLQAVCRDAMEEFLLIAEKEGINLGKQDIDDVIEYFVTYVGNKKTSMLMDVINEKKTENDYIAGMALKKAKEHNIHVPIIHSLYSLMEIKEEVYMEKKGIQTMDGLFSEGVEYSDALRMQMNDIAKKMSDKEYARIINAGEYPEQLKWLISYAKENSEYYSTYKYATKLSDFPVMNKVLLNKHYEEVKVHSYDSSRTHSMHTSGSTGIPFTVIQNLAKRERHIADLKYFGAIAGYADHSPMCYLRAKPTATQEQQEKDNIWQLDICNLNAQNLTDYFHVMVEKKCTALIAYPSTLEKAVDFWTTHFTNESSIKCIISTSETLTDEVKAKLKKFFGDEVGVYARYSNTEQGILGQETEENGVYRLNWASYYFEILKMDSDEPAEEGELGRIIITDLYNKAFPMIRYDTGDVARMKKGEGNELPVFSELFGRRMDLIYDLNGEAVSPFLLCRTMRLSRGIEQWQFIQKDEKTYKLKISSTDGTYPNVDKEIENFKLTLGKDAIILVEYVEEIPVLNSLKRKLIVSELNK